MSQSIPQTVRLVLLALLALAWVSCSATTLDTELPSGAHVAPSEPTAESSAAVEVELLAVLKIPAVEIDGAVLGGLSGLTYDQNRDLYYAVSDDSGAHGPPRFYRLKIDWSRGDVPTVSVDGWTALRGLETAELGIDFEGIVLTASDELYLSSEGGYARDGPDSTLLPPFIAKFTIDGELEEIVRFATYFDPEPRAGRGSRHNLGPEALTLDPTNRFLFAGFESAIEQDGPVSSGGAGSRSRLIRYDLTNPGATTEWLYPVDPLHASPPGVDSFSVRGLVELLALGPTSLISMERSFVSGVGSTAVLYQIEVSEADGVGGQGSVKGGDWQPVTKAPIADFLDLEIPQDNYEALSWGPLLEDGRRSLLVVSDDNFNHDLQATWLLVFALD